MASFYQEMGVVATELLTEFDQGGLKLVSITMTGPPYDQRPTKTEYPFKGVARGVTGDLLQDDLVQSTDLVVTLDGELAPKMQDKIIIDGEEHAIIKITRLPAAGFVVAWQLVVRR